MNCEDEMKTNYFIYPFVILLLFSNLFSQTSQKFPKKILVIVDSWNYENPLVGDDAILTSLSKLSFGEIEFLQNFLHIEKDNFLLIRSKSKEDVIGASTILNRISDFLSMRVSPKEKVSLFFYYSGHGTTVTTSSGRKIRCLLPENTLFKKGEFINYFSEEQFYDFSLNMRHKFRGLKIFLFLDACYQLKTKFKAGEILD